VRPWGKNLIPDRTQSLCDRGKFQYVKRVGFLKVTVVVFIGLYEILGEIFNLH
jgi:hypothetical protein